jgi:hypothetical protein
METVNSRESTSLFDSFRILQLVSFAERLDFGRGAAAFSVRT